MLLPQLVGFYCSLTRHQFASMTGVGAGLRK
jgi:hypothetical protein